MSTPFSNLAVLSVLTPIALLVERMFALSKQAASNTLIVVSSVTEELTPPIIPAITFGLTASATTLKDGFNS